MNAPRWILIAALVLAGAYAAPAVAENITIPDRMGTGTGWYSRDREDQEVEAGMQTGQKWDLEGFFLTGTKLTMVGGFNFMTGEGGFSSGDIFIDTSTPFDAVYGDPLAGSFPRVPPNGSISVTGDFGYDYVVDLDFGTGKYKVYALDDASVLKTTYYYNHNLGSNPWAYNHSDNPDDTFVAEGTIRYDAAMTNAKIHSDLGAPGTTLKIDGGLTTGYHYAATVDLGFLGSGQEFLSHFTMQCGNDDLMGRGATPVPEPGTLMLLGSGMVGLVWYRRRKRMED